MLINVQTLGQWSKTKVEWIFSHELGKSYNTGLVLHTEWLLFTQQTFIKNYCVLDNK